MSATSAGRPAMRPVPRSALACASMRASRASQSRSSMARANPRQLMRDVALGQKALQRRVHDAAGVAFMSASPGSPSTHEVPPGVYIMATQRLQEVQPDSRTRPLAKPSTRSAW